MFTARVVSPVPFWLVVRGVAQLRLNVTAIMRRQVPGYGRRQRGPSPSTAPLVPRIAAVGRGIP